MADDNNLDITGAFDAGSQKMDLTDLEKRGFKKVKVLDQKAMEEFIRKAVDRVVSTQTADEKARIIEESQKELDRLLKENRASKTKAQLLESNKNELAETVTALQRELELKSELEEERLHKKFAEGTASMQSQVEEVRRRAQETADEIEKLRVENARLQEKSQRVRETETRLDATLKDVQELSRENSRYQTELEGAGKRLNELETGLEKEQSRLREAEHARTEMVEQVLKLQAKEAASARSLKELDALRAQLTRAEELVRDGARDNGALKARVADLEEKSQKASSDAARLEGENDPIRKELAHLRAGVAALEASLAEERTRTEAAETRARERQSALDRAHAEVKSLEKALNEERPKNQAAGEEAAELRKRLDAAETRGWDTQAALDRATPELASLRSALDAERSKVRAAVDEAAAARDRYAESKARESEVQNRLADADRVEVERVHLEQELGRLKSELAALDPLRKERDAAREALEELKNEAGSLRMEIARREKDEESARERTIIVTSDLEAIEEKRLSEQEELHTLRQKAQTFEEELATTRAELVGAHEEMKSLQEIMTREQDAAREAHNEVAAAQAKMQDLTSNAARLEEKVSGLLEQSQRLTERLRSTDVSNAANSALDHRLAAVERLMDQARQLSGTARASAADSRSAAAEMRKTVVQQNSPKRKAGSRVQGGVALDGHALLQEFFRRIRLKERLQKHVPVREKDGQRHPSDMLVDVVSALIGGDRRPGKEKGARLEILGAQRGPDVADLRQFLGRVSPQAGHAVSNVHSALRHSLFSMPEKPGRLVLDVGSVDLPRSYRPLVAYEPESKEFWHGELRTTSDKDTLGIVPFLKECVSKVPGGFPRSRVRFRLDARYFSEDVVRFLNGRGCSYVMEAPDLKAIRDAAKKAKYYELSGGWEASEFQQRIHPIRKTMGRFAVVRHRLSRVGKPEGPMFRDQTWEYVVYVVDSRISPWRAHQAYVGRPASQGESAALLTDFTRSRLLGRRRRSHGALFPLYLLASDLVQWFRRKALPMEERGRDLDNLRTELLRLPTTQERMGLQRLPVVAKNDKHRKSFDRVTRKLKRLRAAKPFKFRK